MIGGVRKVLKSSSKGFEVIELKNIPKGAGHPKYMNNSSNKTMGPIPNNKNIDVAIKDEIDTKSISENPMAILEKEADLQAERDLMAELLKVCVHNCQFFIWRKNLIQNMHNTTFVTLIYRSAKKLSNLTNPQLAINQILRTTLLQSLKNLNWPILRLARSIRCKK